jgi:quercetin dioxygenase-like cupin family protein
VAEGDGFTIAHADDLERNGRWGLVRRSIALGSFGMNLVEIEPGGQIPEHTEAERNHEEVFVILRGDAVAVIDGEDHPVRALSFVRVAPDRRRTVRNDSGNPVQLLIASAPTTSGFEPLAWA